MINCTLLKPIGLIAIIILSGCVEPSTPVDGPTQSSCRAEEISKLLWRPASALSEVSQNGLRIIHPDTRVTMDFRPERTNVVIGKSGRIERVYCG